RPAAPVVPTGETPPTVPTAAPTHKGWIDVRVWKRERLEALEGLRLSHLDALPLEADDEIRIEAELDRPAYLYVIWIDSEGIAPPVYPWRPGHWEDSPTQEQPTPRLSLPRTVSNRYPISAAEPGMETLVLLVRESPWPREVDLRPLLAGLPQPQMQ